LIRAKFQVSNSALDPSCVGLHGAGLLTKKLRAEDEAKPNILKSGISDVIPAIFKILVELAALSLGKLNRSQLP
jgi:hypothetical protein